MIVTRRRKKPFPWRRLFLPVIAIGLVVFASLWAPSRNVISNGPLAPVWRDGGTAFAGISAPFHFAAQNQAMTDLKHQIVVLQAQVADAKAKSQAKDKRVTELQATIAQLQTQAANDHAKPAAPLAIPNGTMASSSQGAALTFASGDLSAGATPDMRRTAQYWTNMDPDNAAKVVQKLPTTYVARVMSLMSPDAAGSLLDALPATFAAELTQEHPELRR